MVVAIVILLSTRGTADSDNWLMHLPEKTMVRYKLFLRHVNLKFQLFVSIKALSHGAIFFATCNAILLLVDVKLANTRFHPSQFANIFLTYQTFVTNLHLLRVELRCKLPGKLHRVTGPLIFYR